MEIDDDAAVAAEFPYWAIIQGLSGATELNGRLARVLGPPNADGRHPVAVGHPYAAGLTPDAAFQSKLVRPANLYRPHERPPLASIAAVGAPGEPCYVPCLGVASLVLGDAMCPRQRLRLRLSREEDSELAASVFFGAPHGTLGMLGMMSGRGAPCSHGVELHLEQPLSVARPPPSFEGSGDMATSEAELQRGSHRAPAHELAAMHPPSPILPPQLGSGRVAIAAGVDRACPCQE